MKIARILVILCLGFFISQTANADVLMSFHMDATSYAPETSFEAVFTDFNDITDGPFSSFLSFSISDKNYTTIAWVNVTVSEYNGAPNYGVAVAYTGKNQWAQGGWNGPFDHYGTYVNPDGGKEFTLSEYTPTAVPEPGILILLGISMASVAGLRRWWKD